MATRDIREFEVSELLVCTRDDINVFVYERTPKKGVDLMHTLETGDVVISLSKEKGRDGLAKVLTKHGVGYIYVYKQAFDRF